jgi:hypothetical protein
MKVDDAILKALYQGYSASRKPDNRKGCPSSLEIINSFEPSTSIRKKKRIIDHVSECSFCREEFILLFEVQKSSPALPGIKDATARHRSRADTSVLSGPSSARFWQYACCLLGLGLMLSSLFLIISKKYLSEAERAEQTELRLLSPKTGQSVSLPVVFRWQARAEVDHYGLELFDEALLPIWASGEIRGVQMRLPPHVLAILIPGKSYYWMVTSYSKNSETHESRLSLFKILN